MLTSRRQLSYLKDKFEIPITNGTISDIPKACLNYDSETHSYEPAAEVVQKAKEEDSKSGAGRLQISSVWFWTLTLIGGFLLGLL